MKRLKTIPRGAVLTAPFPFSDLSAKKRRPVVALVPTDGDDVIVAFVTTNITAAGPYGVIVKEGERDFRATGFKKSSAVRVDRIATLDRKIMRGVVGHLPERHVREMVKDLKQLLAFVNASAS